MYKKLQRRFMWVSTLVLLMVISLVAIFVYWIASGTVMSQTVVLMNLILDNGGELPDHSDFDSQQEAFLALNEESIHETRYFSVREDADGGALVSMRMAAIDESEALSLAEKALRKPASYGRMRVGRRRTLHYARRAEDSGTLVVFLDSTSRSGLIRLVMVYTAALWFVVLALYVIIMGKYSKKLVQPFIENDERQKRFITNASHELKTPLAVISANTEMTEVLGGQSKWTESTRRQVKRLQTLIEDLVVLTRLDEMKDVAMEDADLSALIAETAEPFRSVVEGSGRSFRCEIAPDIRAKVDKRGLQQVASILLDNAAKYCDEGGAVSVALSPRGRGARLSVSNTYAEGKNVDTSRFFERFYRQDESHNSAKSGFGIGLSMAREIVARMRGKLKVACSGDIITFTVEI